MRRGSYAENEDRIVAMIIDYVARRGYPPTVREIGEHMGYESTSTTHEYLQRLVRAGRITFVARSPRTIRVVR